MNLKELPLRIRGIFSSEGTPLLSKMPSDLREKIKSVEPKELGQTLLEINRELKIRGRVPMRTNDLRDARELNSYFNS